MVKNNNNNKYISKFKGRGDIIILSFVNIICLIAKVLPIARQNHYINKLRFQLSVL